jgi:hypothetical protein
MSEMVTTSTIQKRPGGETQINETPPSERWKCSIYLEIEVAECHGNSSFE